MIKTLVIGSGNKDKAAELRTLLAGLPYDVKSTTDFPPVPEPEETADTFEGNALLKARYYAGQYGFACVADDSGLEVDALNGAPGVYSARYAGQGCTSADNNDKLLGALKSVALKDRTARFVCCAAYVGVDGHSHVVRGIVEGVIAAAPRGSNGFGYDPLFVPAGFTQTFGEMIPETKHEISHRGRAFREMKSYLEALVAVR